jgi:type I restriction enzyme M protein
VQGGHACQGESYIRRWIIENDWLEAIVALPLNLFYSTGIATYIWVLSNRKPKNRKGQVQLIDASQWLKPLRKNLDKKNCSRPATTSRCFTPCMWTRCYPASRQCKRSPA